MWERPAAYAAVAALAAIGFLLVATDWHARDKKPAAIAIPPNAPPTIATTNQSIAVSVRVDPQFAEEGLRSATEGQPPQDAIGLAELAELLGRAHRQIEAFALTTPPGDNALETLQRVLAAMPAQPDTLRGLREIASQYALLAVQADNRGERDLAKRYLDKGLGLVPDHPDLLAVQWRLAAPLGPLPATEADRSRIVPNRLAGISK
jgi:hypothetical protein